MPLTYSGYQKPFEYEDVMPVTQKSYSVEAYIERIDKLEKEVELLKTLIMNISGVPELIDKISGQG